MRGNSFLISSTPGLNSQGGLPLESVQCFILALDDNARFSLS
jgi:hypothetical protein